MSIKEMDAALADLSKRTSHLEDETLGMRSDLTDVKTAVKLLSASIEQSSEIISETRDILGSFRVLGSMAKMIAAVSAAIGSLFALWKYRQ